MAIIWSIRRKTNTNHTAEPRIYKFVQILLLYTETDDKNKTLIMLFTFEESYLVFLIFSLRRFQKFYR